jgi:multicomponent Na+:H+ antiporter subunit F
MVDALLGLAILVLILMGLGLIRIFRGPTGADRMMAAQLLGTAGVALLLLLWPVLALPALVDVALVLGLLAAVAVAAFASREGGS